MKSFLMILLSILLFAGCKKDEDVKTDNRLNLTTIAGWPTIEFKTDYTIQVPADFEGVGLIGFEGQSFSKHSADNRIVLESGYSDALYVYDFGDTLHTPTPKSIQVMTNDFKWMTLDKTQFFCDNSDSIGVFYYSNKELTKGRLFWKDNNLFKQALEVDFYLSELETVSKIISTIKRK